MLLVTQSHYLPLYPGTEHFLPCSRDIPGPSQYPLLGSELECRGLLIADGLHNSAQC